MKKHYAALAAAITIPAVAQADNGSWTVYGGADYLYHEVSVTVQEPAPNGPPGALGSSRRADGDGSSVRLNGGVWLNEDFAVEVQGTVSSDEVDNQDQTAEIDSYYGVFLKARAEVFDWMDMTFPVGFASVEATAPDGEDGRVNSDNDGVAFGMNFNFKLGRVLADRDAVLAGLDVGLGFMVYNSSENVNVRGYNGGLRFAYDF